MQYISHYQSPLGGILLAADDTGLTGLWFEGQKYFALYLDKEHEEKEIPLFNEAKHWLDIYFSGKYTTLCFLCVPGKYSGPAVEKRYSGCIAI